MKFYIGPNQLFLLQASDLRAVFSTPGVEIDEIRNQEEKVMMEDATSWVNSKNINEQYNFQGSYFDLFIDLSVVHLLLFKLAGKMEGVKVFHSLFRSYFSSFIRSVINLFVRSFLLLFAPSIFHSFGHSFIPSYKHTFSRSFLLSFAPSFVHSFIYLYIHSSIHLKVD